MYNPIPPTIPPHTINNSNFTNNLHANSILTVNLSVTNELSFFGVSSTPQIIINPTLDSIILALQKYGLTPSSYIQQGSKLIGTGATGNAEQGIATRLSADGNTLAIGAYSDNGGIGATWIFTRTNSVWAQQGNKLVGSDAIGNSKQGYCIALSSDGNTLAVGGFEDNSNIGATWIFTRSGTTWTQQGSKLIGTDAVGNSRQGISVDLSADGNTLAIGGSIDNSNIGAIWIFTRSGTTWTQEGTKLVGTGNVGNSSQGISVALSANGNTVGVGGNGDNSNTGAVWIFTRSGTIWTQQGSKLVGTGATSSAYQGFAIALKGDTLVSGGYEDNSGIGATWVFKRSGTTWTQQGAKLIGTGAVGNAYQGDSVSLNGDETILITAGGGDNGIIGAVWIFKLANGVWTQFGEKLVPIGNVGQSKIGYELNNICISSDGTTISAGGYGDNSSIGATWIFVGTVL